jgi:cell division protein FtsB
MLAEVRRLQQRVRDLEDELGRAKAENDALAAAVHGDSFDRELLDAVKDREPALT